VVLVVLVVPVRLLVTLLLMLMLSLSGTGLTRAHSCVRVVKRQRSAEHDAGVTPGAVVARGVHRRLQTVSFSEEAS
jgi:UPF0716 family protein affecting phage T7 exclusion